MSSISQARKANQCYFLVDEGTVGGYDIPRGLRENEESIECYHSIRRRETFGVDELSHNS
jgi:hypothetical protein